MGGLKLKNSFASQLKDIFEFVTQLLELVFHLTFEILLTFNFGEQGTLLFLDGFDLDGQLHSTEDCQPARGNFAPNFLPHGLTHDLGKSHLFWLLLLLFNTLLVTSFLNLDRNVFFFNYALFILVKDLTMVLVFDKMLFPDIFLNNLGLSVHRLVLNRDSAGLKGASGLLFALFDRGANRRRRRTGQRSWECLGATLRHCCS